MRITEQKLNHLLAVEVMKWRMLHKVGSFDKTLPHSKEGYPIEDWNPTRDANHALQLLKAHGVIARFAYFPDQNIFSVGIGGWESEVESESDNLCHAICLAVAEAETGIKYELVKE